MSENINQQSNKVYISLTSIYQNQDILLHTLHSIINQTKLPDKIFLYLSEEEYILDKGFKNKNITNIDLLNFINNNEIISLNWVKNTGPYRKLLPLLKDKWSEDCVIITIDDDTIYDNNLIKNMLEDYNKFKCVINYRSFTPLFINFKEFNYEKKEKLKDLSLYNFPTGKGGILYHPSFFYKTEELIFNENIYLKLCDKQDDVWFYIIRVLNNIGCYGKRRKWLEKDISKRGLFVVYNNKNNNNTIVFKNVIKKLEELNYKF